MHDASRPVTATPVQPAQILPPSRRDPRLDVFRGLCLVMIFINHVPQNAFEPLTSRNFGFSDAAEGFVMMSGIAAGLAYSADFRVPGRFMAGLTRIWKRCWTLYLVHILVTAGALAMAAASVLLTDDSRILFENNMRSLWVRPLETLVALPLMLHQFGYVNILPVYLVLLLVTPLVLVGAWRRPMLVWAGAVLVWAVAGAWHLGMPNWPLSGVWFFNPLTWQVVFVTGLLIGVALKDGRRLVPVLGWLKWLTGAFLLYAALSVQIPELSKITGKSLWLLKEATGLPWNFTAFDKTYVTAPRLLHILALTYFISCFPVIRRLCGLVIFAPLELLGRQALPVFALGSILCIGLQGMRHTLPHTLATDAMLIGGGLALQFALAAARQYWPKPAKA